MQKKGIRSKLFIYFSSAMAAILLIVIVAFNLASTGLTERQAERQLSEAYEAVTRRQTTGMGMGHMDDNMRSNAFRMAIRQGNVFSDVETVVVDRSLNIVNGSATDDSVRDIVDQSREHLVGVREKEIRTVETDTGSYFVELIPITEEGDQFLLAFVNMSKFRDISSGFQRILIMVILLALAITVIFVVFLTKSIVNPIYKLRGLALRMGDGHFKGEDFNFQEKELSDLNDSMNEAARKISEYNENQKIFFQNVSHELRTPLTSIEGYAEGIKYGVFNNIEASDVILAESEKLSGLVEDILFMSKMESMTEEHQEKTRTDLSELLRESVDRSASSAKKNRKEIRVKEIEKGLHAMVNTEEILRALDNVMSNAIRYAESAVSVSLVKEQGNGVIRIEDDGQGIEAKDLPHIFERFYKGSKGNHGIGLSIAETAVKRHQGTIRAENTGKGARFSIALPLGN